MYVDDCEVNSQPCENGATCVDRFDSYTCICSLGYTGATCGENIDDCSANACENGAACVDGVASYNCTCALGFTGEYCSENIDDCAAHACANGAMCVDGIASYNCTCAAGYNDTLCETIIDECATLDCPEYYICVNTTYECEPIYGVDPCLDDPCYSGASCAPLSATEFVCDCPAGTTGAVCELDVDECVEDEPCVHGTCTNLPGTFACECLAGYNGTLCDMDIDECASLLESCLHGGVCNNTDGSFDCTCAHGYTGPRCETQASCGTLPDPFVVRQDAELHMLDMLGCGTLFSALHVLPEGRLLNATLAATALGRLRVVEKHVWVNQAVNLSLGFLQGLEAVGTAVDTQGAAALLHGTHSLIVENSTALVLPPTLSLQQVYARASATGLVRIDGRHGGFCTADTTVLAEVDAGLWWVAASDRLQLAFDVSLCNGTCRLLSNGSDNCANTCTDAACPTVCAAPLELQTTAHVEAFVAATGGSGAPPCVLLDGDLILRETEAAALPALRLALRAIRRIAGNLFVEKNSALLDLCLLETLEEVHSILLAGNPVLGDARLPHLRSGADVILGYNPFLCATAGPYGDAPCPVVVTLAATATLEATSKEAAQFLASPMGQAVLQDAVEKALLQAAGNDSAVLDTILATNVTASLNGTDTLQMLSHVLFSIPLELADSLERLLLGSFHQLLVDGIETLAPGVVSTATNQALVHPPQLDFARSKGTHFLRLLATTASETALALTWGVIAGVNGSEPLALDLFLRYRPAASAAQLSALHSLLLREAGSDIFVPLTTQRLMQIESNVPDVFNAVAPWRTLTVPANRTGFVLQACSLSTNAAVAGSLTSHLSGSPCVPPGVPFEFELRGLNRDSAAAQAQGVPLTIESNRALHQLPRSSLTPLHVNVSADGTSRVQVMWTLAAGVVASHVELQFGYASAFDAPMTAPHTVANIDHELLNAATFERIVLPLAETGSFVLEGCWAAVATASAETAQAGAATHCVSPFTLYRIRVVVRGEGLSSGSADAFAATAPGRPASPVRDLTVTDADATSALLRFCLPTLPRGVLTSVLVELYALPYETATAEGSTFDSYAGSFPRQDVLPLSSTATLQALAPNATFTTYIADLQPYYAYRARIRARTAGGTAPVSTAAVVNVWTAEAEPNAPSTPKLATPSSGEGILLTWSPTLPHRGRLLRFEVSYRAPNVTEQTVLVNATLGHVLYSARLPLNTSLDLAVVRVRAVTAAGVGRWSAQATPVASSSKSGLFTSKTIIAALSGGVGALLLLIAVLGTAIQRRRKRQVVYYAPPADEYEIDRGQLVLGALLGTGAYGEVYDASATRLQGDPGVTRVAVKQCHLHQATVKAKRDFLDEMTVMKVR